MDQGTEILKKLLSEIEEMNNEEYIELFNESKEEYKEFEELMIKQDNIEE